MRNIFPMTMCSTRGQYPISRSGARPTTAAFQGAAKIKNREPYGKIHQEKTGIGGGKTAGIY